MKKVLLSVAAFSFLTAGYAQALLTYGFEEGDKLPGKIVAENWTNYENSTYDWASTDAAHEGARGLYVNVAAEDCGEDGNTECGNWERVIALTNTGFEENKSYRVSLCAKGNGKINVALLKGCFNHDCAPFNITKDVTIDGTYTKYSFIYWSPSREVMTEQKSDFTNDEYWNQDFLRLSFKKAGIYNVDDITIEETVIEGVSANAGVMKVNYGYSWASNNLAAEGGIYLPTESATVTVDDEELEVKSVELQNDGYTTSLYIFYDADEYDPESDGEALVSFKKPADIDMHYTAEASPKVLNEGQVLDFENVVTTYDDELAATSLKKRPASLVSSNPANNSFEIDPATKEFSFTFDRVVMCAATDNNDAPEVTLSGTGVNETLIITSKENGETLTFKRPEGAAAFAKGNYTLTIDNIVNESDRANDAPFTVVFEVGTISLSETIYTDIVTTLVSGDDDAIPTGWTCMINGDPSEPWTGGKAWAGGSACRNIAANGIQMFYLCDRDTYDYLVYGDQEEYRITLPAGNIEFSVLAVGHSVASTTVEFRLEDMNGNEVLYAKDNTSIVASDCTSPDAASKITGQFNNTSEQNFILKVHNVASNVWNQAARIVGFKAQSYTETEGDKYESTIYLQDKTFGDAEDNHAPKAGSGWAIYQEGAKRDAGGDFNYNGTRIFKLGIKNLSVGYYTNGYWNDGASHYIIYGEGGEGEPTLTLPKGSLQMTYYAANWKTDERILYFQLLDEENEVVDHRTDKITTPNMGSNRNASVEATKIEFNLNVPAAGNYKIKFGGDGEMFVGNITIEKPGSTAALYHEKLNGYIKEAKAELEISADEKYDGATKTALIEAVAKYSAVPNGMHTPEEYNAACQYLDALTKALATRRSNIDTYASALSALQDAVTAATDTKYEQLEAYATATALIESYLNQNPQDLDDEALATAVANIQNVAKYLSNMSTVCCGLLTKQIVNLVRQIIELDAEMEESEDIIAAGNAITDDQALVKALKLYLTGKIYEKLGKGEDIFSTFDPEMETYTHEDIELPYIQNPMFYTTLQTSTTNYEGNAESYPGWDIDIQACNVMAEYGWVANDGTKFNANYPITDASLITTWGDCDITVSQELSELPVGKYNVVISTMDRSYVNQDEEGNWVATSGETTSNVFVQQSGAEEPIEQIFNIANIGQYYGMSETSIEGIEVAAGDNLTGSFLFGAHMTTHGGTFAAVDNAKIIMTGAAEGFDYASAAKTVLEEAANGIEIVAREDAPIAARYFNLNGQEIGAAEGICIKIETYADGYMVVKKIVK